MARREDAGARRELDRLRALALDPPRRAAFALEVLAGSSSNEAILGALAALSETPTPGRREPLLAAFARLSAPRKDPGGFLREAVLRALRPVAGAEDVALLESAVSTIEPSPQDMAGGTALRATALVNLSDLDPELSGFHAAAMLAAADDPRRTSLMNGEPAVTAARVLGALGQQLPLVVALRGMANLHGDVYAECLRQLEGVPGSLLGTILEAAAGDRRESVQLGLCDLLVNHRPAPALEAAAARFLRETRDADLYRYLVASAVAERRAELIAVIAAAASEEQDRGRLGILAEQLGVRRGDDLVAGALAVVERRLEGLAARKDG